MGQAAAHPLRVALEPARTRVRRGHEGEPGGEIHGAGGPGNDDTPVLERLPQAFQGVAPKLAQLIEEEDSVVCQRDLTRSQEAGTPAKQARAGDRMVRRPERTD